MTTPIAAHLYADAILECLLQQLRCHHHLHHAIIWMFNPGQRQLLSSFFSSFLSRLQRQLYCWLPSELSVKQGRAVSSFSCNYLYSERDAGLTTKAVGHIGLKDDLAEDGGQWEGLVAFIPQWNVPVAGLQAVQGQDTLSNQFVVIVVHSDAQNRQIW